MKNINYLTRYLNPRKHSIQSQGTNELVLVRIDNDLIESNGSFLSEETTKLFFKYPIEDFIEFNQTYDEILHLDLNLGPLYVDIGTSGTLYFFQKEINNTIKYLSAFNAKNFNTSDEYYQSMSDTNFNLVPLEANQKLFYHKEEGVLYLSEEVLPTLTLTVQRSLAYNPKELGGLRNGISRLEYKSPSSNLKFNFITEVLIDIARRIAPTVDEKKKVKLTLNPQKGNLYWYPEVTFNKTSQHVTLFYDYNLTQNEEYNFILRSQEYAIKMEFYSPEVFFAFMKLTYFDNGISPYDLNDHSGIRKTRLFQNYTRIFNILLTDRKISLFDKLSYLFFIPEDFFLKNQTLFSKESGPDNKLGLRFVWYMIRAILTTKLKDVEISEDLGLEIKIIATGNVLLKLLEILKVVQKDDKAQDVERNNYILKELTTRKISGELSYLQAMYEGFDNEGLIQFSIFLYKVWYKSNYIDPTNPVYKDTSPFITKDKKSKLARKYPQLMLPYRTNKLLGFYSSNMNLDFNEKGNIVVTPDESALGNAVKGFSPITGYLIDKIKEPDWTNEYHPLQPVYLMNPDKDKAFTLQKISPMLFLKANEDQSFWSNVSTATDYAFDIITTASGIGNLTKFRHLARTVRILRASGEGRKVILAYEFSKLATGAAAIVEITAGTVNALLKITGINDTEFGAALSEFLFWIELFTLSGEVLSEAAIKRMKVNAEILTDEKRHVLKRHLDDARKKGEIDEIDELLIYEELKAVQDFQDLIKTKKKQKNVKGYRAFIEKWSAKDSGGIIKIPREEIADNLRGFTEEANRVADIVEDGTMKFYILDEDAFKKKFLEHGGKEADYDNPYVETNAFAAGPKSYFKNKMSPEKFMSSIVHEGVHNLDFLYEDDLIEQLYIEKSIGSKLTDNEIWNEVNKQVEDILGDNHSWEKRAYFHERAFQIATQSKVDHVTIKDLIDHILEYYKKEH